MDDDSMQSYLNKNSQFFRIIWYVYLGLGVTVSGVGLVRSVSNVNRGHDRDEGIWRHNVQP